MRRLLIVVIALCSVAAQPPAQSPRVPEESLPASEKQIPPDHYCKRPDVAIGKTETRAHHCPCTYACTIDASGNVTETGGEKSEACLSFCEKNGRHCTCHVEESCIGTRNALIDMDGRVVAMRRRAHP